MYICEKDADPAVILNLDGRRIRVRKLVLSKAITCPDFLCTVCTDVVPYIDNSAGWLGNSVLESNGE